MCVARTFSEPLDLPASASGSVQGLPGVGDWHALDTATVVTGLGVDPAQGLAAAEVNKRRVRHGSNALQVIQPRPAWRILIDQFASIVIALLGNRIGRGLGYRRHS